MNRILVILAGLAGAAGVALAARAAHAGPSNLGVASNMLLFHAPALLAIGLWSDRTGRVLIAAGTVLALGVLLFSGDLVARDMLDGRLFPLAAPAGGVLMIAGWLGIVVGALAGPRVPRA